MHVRVYVCTDLLKVWARFLVSYLILKVWSPGFWFGFRISSVRFGSRGWVEGSGFRMSN